MTVPLIRLNKGDYIEIDGVRWNEKERTPSTLILQRFDGPELQTFTGEQLRDLYFAPQRRMRIVRRDVQELDETFRERVQRPFDTFDEDQQREMLVRLDYVKACDRFFARKLYSKTIDGYGKISQIVARYRRSASARNAGLKTCQVPLEIFHGSTVRDWYVRWRKGVRHIGALAPLNERKGNRRDRMDPAVERLIAFGVNQKWLTLEAPPVTVVHDFICREVVKLNEARGANHREPSEMAVRRWIRNNVDAFTQVLRRKGRKEAEHQFRLTKRAPVAIRPLQIVEFDDTPLDLMLVDANGKPEGRAYLTAGTCLATGMVVGWHIGTDKPSWTTLMQALRMAILKKDLTDTGCQSPYPVYGVPEMVKCDNGAPYRSTSLVAAAGQLQFELRLVPVGRPHLKGKVERFFLEVNRDFTSVLPGRTFSNVQERGDYDPAECSAFTLQEVRKLFTRWVVDIYHNRPNSRAFGQTPLERWQALAGCGVRLPPEKDDLTPLLGLIVYRTIVAEGITFMGLTYASPRLRDFKQEKLHLGKHWMVKVDPLDMTELLVLDEARHRWEPVKCKDTDLVLRRSRTDEEDRPLTLREWMDVVKEARRKTSAGKYVTRGTLLRAREYIMKIAEEKGNVPKGEKTPRDREWLQDEVLKPQYDIEINPSEADSADSSATRQRKRKKPVRDPGRAKAEVEPASTAGGVPLPVRNARDESGEAMADARRQVQREEQQAGIEKLQEESKGARKRKVAVKREDQVDGSKPGTPNPTRDLPIVDAPSVTPDADPSRRSTDVVTPATKSEVKRAVRNEFIDIINDPNNWGRDEDQEGESK